MSHSISTMPDWGYLTTELACYLQTDATAVALTGMHMLEHDYNAQYIARHYQYQLTLGKLQLLELTLYLPFDTGLANIEAVRMIAVKAALSWYKASLSKNEDNDAVSYEALIFDIQLVGGRSSAAQNDKDNKKHNVLQRLKHSFGARYFLEDLVVDMNENTQQLQVFSWDDWYSIAAAVRTPCELWHFLSYHLEQLQHSATSHVPSFESEEALVKKFLQSPDLFVSAIAVDNALIKNEAQDEPNPALVAITLAYKNQSTTAQMYHQHMLQAAMLWSQLSMQMIETYSEKQKTNTDDQLDVPLVYWQQQLLDESLFSRHELIRTIYRHLKQSASLQKDGYVVHQHSYESLGRHYVLVFYGQEATGHNSKATVQPKLAQIAKDVATRLPIIELHHVIVLGIDFITEADDTFIDIDLWIQPVDTMTQRERQLTKQLQRLKHQDIQHQHDSSQPIQQTDSKMGATKKAIRKDSQVNGRPQVHLNLSIPARKEK
ncbi:hypothetical protein IPZ60_13985 [Psychrobacter sp. NG25]|uniref:hypothetical protein n=1 Tax=Psychrobacter sp. NG25 TaxID=2782005 RepID=UPI0018840358|nr:hypothetical protein [Psychrobacter sp. NG25]MBF0659852.1 hypothetical protein [Psychrobacter sp. NG25]